MDQALTSQELFIPTHHPVWIFPFTLVRDRSAQARALPPSHPRYRPTARPHAFTLTRCTLGTPHTARHNTRHLRTWTLGPAPRLRPGPHGPHAHGPSPRPFGSDPARPSPLYTPRAQSIIGHEQPQRRGEWRRRLFLDPWCVSKGAPSPAQSAGARGSIPAVGQRPDPGWALGFDFRAGLAAVII